MTQISSKALKMYGKKSIPQLIVIATNHFNKYIRLRDSANGIFQCISCGTWKSTSFLHCGHYLSAGHNAATRFDEDNCAGQCSACNTHLHGNMIWYRQRLITKIGVQKVELLEVKAKMVHKWDRTSLIYIIETYKEKCNQIAKAA